MTFPQSTLYGHLGVRSSTQFAAMAAANFVAQTILVDDGSTSLKEYRSDGVGWVPSLNTRLEGYPPFPAQSSAVSQTPTPAVQLPGHGFMGLMSFG